MKKIILLLAIVLILGGAVFLAFRFGLIGTPYAERIFPNNTAAFISLGNTGQAIENFHQTLLWKKIDKSPRKQNYARLAARVSTSLESLTGIDLRPVFSQFTRDVALGAYPLESGNFSFAFSGYVDNEGRFRKAIEQNMDPNMKRRLPDLRKTEANYGGISYYKYSSERFPSGSSPSYYLADHHFVVSWSEAGLKQLLDVRSKKLDSLGKSELFRNARKGIRFRRRGLFFFLNADAVLRTVESGFADSQRGLWLSLLKISGAGAIRSFAYSIEIDKDGFREKGFLAAGPQREGLFKVYMDQPARKLELLSAVPADVRVVTAGTLPDFARMWDEANSRMGSVLNETQYNRWKQALSVMRGLFNFDVRRDLFEPVGQEFAIASQPDASNPDPARMIYLIQVQMDRPDQFKQTLDRVVSLGALQGVQKTEVSYKGKNVREFQFSVGNLALQPAYYMDGPLFALASRADMLRRSIDVRSSGGRKLIDQPDYRKVTAGFPGQVNSLNYTDIQTLLKMYARVLGRQASSPDGQWIRDFQVDQELDYLATGLYGSASYSKIGREGVEIHAFSPVPTGLLAVPSVISNLPKMIEEYNKRREK